MTIDWAHFTPLTALAGGIDLPFDSWSGLYVPIGSV